MKLKIIKLQPKQKASSEKVYNAIFALLELARNYKITELHISYKIEKNGTSFYLNDDA